MGSIIFSLGEFLNELGRRQFNVLVSGPASSGRTAFLLRNLKGKYVDPSISEEIEVIQFKRNNCILNVVDSGIYLSGNQASSRFFGDKSKSISNANSKDKFPENKNCNRGDQKGTIEKQGKFDGVLFFIDSSDHGRLPLARRLLIQLIEKVKNNCPIILIVAAKQDALGALNPKELATELNIDEIMQIFGDGVCEYGVIGVSSYTGLGCKESLDWITESIWKHQLFCFCIPFNSFCYNLYSCSV